MGWDVVCPVSFLHHHDVRLHPGLQEYVSTTRGGTMEAVTPVDLGSIEMRPNGRSYALPSGMWGAL